MLLPFLMITVQIKPHPDYAGEIWIICFSCLLRHTSTCALTLPRVNKGYIYIFSFYLKSEVSTWRRFKRSPLTLRLRNLKTKTSSAIFDLCLNKSRAGNHMVIVTVSFLKSSAGFEIFSVQTAELLMILHLEAIRHDKWLNHKACGFAYKKRNKKQSKIENAIKLDCGGYLEDVIVFTGQYVHSQSKKQILKTHYKTIFKIKSTRTLKAISNEKIIKEKFQNNNYEGFGLSWHRSAKPLMTLIA